MLPNPHTANSASLRRNMVRWLYAAAIAHFLVGVLLAWLGNSAVFENYQHSIEVAFWGKDAPVAARAQQVWWIALFGATVQSYALYMWALIRIGDRHKSTATWGWLIAGIVIWAPQDILISLQANIWSHVWVDCFALASLLPPLIWLYRHDRGTTTTELTLRERHHV